MTGIYNESCIDTMLRMQDGFIDLTVTSPPYDNLRDYNGYSFPFEDIARELYRVTKQGGVVVWVVKDATIDGNETLTSFKQALFFQQCGFKVYDTMIYSKMGGGLPQASRYRDSFEYMFVFSKGKPKTINLLRDRKNKQSGRVTGGRYKIRQNDGSFDVGKSNKREIPDVNVRYNIWEYATGKGNSAKDNIAFHHPAIFPEKLAHDHIASWSNEGDLVYDPFMGSGTVAKMAQLSNRKWIGSEISGEYVKIANDRLKPYLNRLF